jgi:hypothetical protein
MLCRWRAKFWDSIWPSVSEGQMVKCTKGQIRQLKAALHWKMPEAQRQGIQMILLREVALWCGFRGLRTGVPIDCGH